MLDQIADPGSALNTVLQVAALLIALGALVISLMAWRLAREAVSAVGSRHSEPVIVKPHYLDEPTFERRPQRPISRAYEDAPSARPSMAFVHEAPPEAPIDEVSSPRYAVMEPPETTESTHMSVLAAYAHLVEAKGVGAEKFINDHQVVPLEPAEAVGRFRPTPPGGVSFIWAVHRAGTSYLMVPSLDAIKRWRFLAAAKGSGALERFNGAFELQAGNGLSVIAPAELDKLGGEFVVQRTGTLSGIEH